MENAAAKRDKNEKCVQAIMKTGSNTTNALKRSLSTNDDKVKHKVILTTLIRRHKKLNNQANEKYYYLNQTKENQDKHNG
jgi:hypothetical protein